ncbi:hypothetical protein SAMN05444170_0001, partial [Bradyrhizobium erythrophlei]
MSDVQLSRFFENLIESRSFLFAGCTSRFEWLRALKFRKRLDDEDVML